MGRKYRHILVDEWQDTNGPQYDLVLQLVKAGRQAQVERAETSRAAEAAQREAADGGGDGTVPERPPEVTAGRAAAAVPSSIFIVGDTDQCIYRFRGADYTNVARFVQDFKECQTVLLGENYRSTANIVRAASAVIGEVGGRDKQDAVDAKAVQVRRDTSLPPPFWEWEACVCWGWGVRCEVALEFCFSSRMSGSTRPSGAAKFHACRAPPTKIPLG